MGMDGKIQKDQRALGRIGDRIIVVCMRSLSFGVFLETAPDSVA